MRTARWWARPTAASTIARQTSSAVPAWSSATTFGSAGRRLRSRDPTIGVTAATTTRLKNIESSRAPTAPGADSPAIGHTCSSTASTTIATQKVGHNDAPRNRQRSRLRHSASVSRCGIDVRVPRYPRPPARVPCGQERGAPQDRRSRAWAQVKGPRWRSHPRPPTKGKTSLMATKTARPEGMEDPGAVGPEHLTLDDRIALLKYMLLMRGIEERAMNLYRQGKVPGSFYDGYGQEAVSVGSSFAMAPEDRLCVLHRDLGAHLVRGVTPARILGQYMGREGGITGGRDGNVHFGDFRIGCVGMVSMLPDMMIVATGMAMAFKLRGEQRCAITWFGDGSTSRGDFHEAMNWAGVQKLPVIFILENNQYAYSTPTASQFAVDPVERAAAYGFPGVTVDGNDAEAMFETVRQARERAVNGEGPTMIEAVTMRMHGHAAHDDMKYVPKAKIEEWKAKDPIDRQERRLTALGVDVAALREEVKQTIDAAVEEALAMPMPDGNTAARGVFAEEPALLEDGNGPWSGFANSPAGLTGAQEAGAMAGSDEPEGRGAAS